jgi:hypothetical protein
MSLATPDLLDLIAARAARDHGMALAEESELTNWTEAADRAIRELIREGVPFSSDDICARVGRPYHPAAVGALFARAVRSGRLEEVGRVQSTRVEARGRKIPVYVGVTA